MKDIIVALAEHLDSGLKIGAWVGLDIDRFLNHGQIIANPQHGGTKRQRAHYDSLFAQREFDPRCVPPEVNPFEDRKLTVSHKFERPGHLLTQARAKVAQ